jgi:glucose/mannose-6-phosphate isomerase
MLSFVQKFTKQISEAIAIGTRIQHKDAKNSINNVVISGLGGSGIGGTIIQQLLAKTLGVPLIVNKDYTIPAFVDKHTLFIASSYSGNTEETIQAFKYAVEKGAQIFCITSGGELEKLAQAAQIETAILPAGAPPRACLNYSLVILLHVLNRYGLINGDWLSKLSTSISFLDEQQASIVELAKELASKMAGKLPILYAETRWESALIRFRQQLNENAKILAWHHVIPEMNHNELVGWTQKQSDKLVFIFRAEDDLPQNKNRVQICSSVIETYAPIIYIDILGDHYLTQMFYFINLTDYISVFLAEINQVDPVEVRVIDYLKNTLAKM